MNLNVKSSTDLARRHNPGPDDVSNKEGGPHTVAWTALDFLFLALPLFLFLFTSKYVFTQTTSTVASNSTVNISENYASRLYKFCEVCRLLDSSFNDVSFAYSGFETLQISSLPTPAAYGQ